MTDTHDTVGDALRYLADCDAPATAIARQARMEEMRKIVLAQLEETSTKQTVRERENEARSCDAFQQFIVDEYEPAVRDAEYHRAKRAWAKAIIDCYQTKSANKRHAENVR